MVFVFYDIIDFFVSSHTDPTVKVIAKLLGPKVSRRDHIKTIFKMPLMLPLVTEFELSTSGVACSNPGM